MRTNGVRVVLAVLFLIFSLRLVSAAAAEEVVAAGGEMVVRGRVVLDGVPPEEKTVPLDEACAALHPAGLRTRFYVVGPEGGLGDVVVFIAEGLPAGNWAVPQKAHELVQEGCVTEPYVSAARTGQGIEVRNVSPLLHNVHITPKQRGNREQNFAQLPSGLPLEFRLGAPELMVPLKCDVHPWEYAYVSTFDHPFFAVTDEDGAFALPALPPGKYVLEAHHRKAGVQRMAVEVGPGMEPLRLVFKVKD